MQKYVIGVPAFGALYLIVFFTVFRLVSGKPDSLIALPLKLLFFVFQLPAGFLLYSPMVDAMKIQIAEAELLLVVAGINALFWGAGLTSMVLRSPLRPPAPLTGAD